MTVRSERVVSLSIISIVKAFTPRSGGFTMESAKRNVHPLSAIFSRPSEYTSISVHSSPASSGAEVELSLVASVLASVHEKSDQLQAMSIINDFVKHRDGRFIGLPTLVVFIPPAAAASLRIYPAPNDKIFQQISHPVFEGSKKDNISG